MKKHSKNREEKVLYIEKDPEVLNSLRKFKKSNLFFIIVGFTGSFLAVGLGTYNIVQTLLLENTTLPNDRGLVIDGLLVFILIYVVLYLPAARASPLKITDKGVYLAVETPLWGKFLPYEKISEMGIDASHTVITFEKKYALRFAYIFGGDTSTAFLGGRRKEVSDIEKVWKILVEQAMKYPHIKIYDGKLEKWIRK